MTEEVTTPIDTSETTTETAPLTQEELYEIAYGNNPDGSKVTKKLSLEELKRQAGHGLGSQTKYEEAKKIQEEMRALAHALKDPEQLFELLPHLGHDVDKLLDHQWERYIKEKSEDPKDRELRITKAQLDKYLKAESEAKERAAKEQEDKATADYQQKFKDKISSALKAAKLTDTPSNVASVARMMNELWNSKDENGKQLFPNPFNIPDDKLVNHLKTSRVGAFKDLVDSAEEDSILELLPEDLQKKITKAITKKLKRDSGASVDNVIKPKTTTSNESTKIKKPKYVSAAQLREQREARSQADYEEYMRLNR